MSGKTRIKLDIHQPEPGAMLTPTTKKQTTHSHTTNLQKWLDHKVKEFPTGTWVTAYIGKTTVHYQLKRGPRWDIVGQVVGP